MNRDQEKEILNGAMQACDKINRFINEQKFDAKTVSVACNIAYYLMYLDCGMTLENAIGFQPDVADIVRQIREIEEEEKGKKVKEKPSKDEQEKMDHLNKILNQANKDHPEVFAQVLKDAKKRGDNFLFSPEIRERMSKFNNMSVEQMLGTEDFWKEMFEHAGFGAEEFEKVKKKVKEETRRGR